MAEFVTAGKTDELKDGQMKMVRIENRDILVAKVSGRYFATDAHCAHMGGNLWEGKLDGTVITCPRHASRFDLTDGHVIRWTNWGGVKLALAKMFKPPRSLKTYEVKAEGNQIMVALK